MNIKDYKFKLPPEELPPLTEEQKKYPYADLYYRELSDPSEAVMKAFEPGNALAPEQALKPEDFKKLLDPDFTPACGYCVLPNGVGYSCTVVDLPGASLELFDYRLKLVFSEDMGFVVEYPGFHFQHYNGLCIEDNHDGCMALILDRNYSAHELGFADLPSKLNPSILGFSAHEQDFVPLEGPIDPEKGRGALFLITKKIPDGLQHIWIVYQGLHVCEGKSVILLGDGETICEEQCRRTGLHTAYESINQVLFIQEMMRRYPDRSFLPERPWPERYAFLKH